ncbi:MAG TPA: heavy-metal-associated domain-containing protein, partial [Burkholderiaceae bacterium]
MESTRLTLPSWQGSESSRMTFKEPEMLTFQVNDMSCGHCVRAIKEAVRARDAEAAVDVDLARHRVRVESGRLDAAGVREAIMQAG